MAIRFHIVATNISKVERNGRDSFKKVNHHPRLMFPKNMISSLKPQVAVKTCN